MKITFAPCPSFSRTAHFLRALQWKATGRLYSAPTDLYFYRQIALDDVSGVRPAGNPHRQGSRNRWCNVGVITVVRRCRKIWK